MGEILVPVSYATYSFHSLNPHVNKRYPRLSWDILNIVGIIYVRFHDVASDVLD